MTPPERSVALVTLGCTRNEVDSEELAGRLLAEGWRLVDDAAEALRLTERLAPANGFRVEATARDAGRGFARVQQALAARQQALAAAEQEAALAA